MLVVIVLVPMLLRGNAVGGARGGMRYHAGAWERGKQVCIRRNNRLVEYTHIYLDHEYPVELSVYPSNEIKVTGRSSTDGKPIRRLSAAKVRALMEEEHAEAWALHLAGCG